MDMTRCREMKGLHASTDKAETWLVLSVELIWLVLAQRWTDESCQLYHIVKVSLEQVLTVRTFVGKQIHLCKGHHLFQGILFHSVSLYLLVSLSLSHVLSLFLLFPALCLLLWLQPEFFSWITPAIGWLQVHLPGRETRGLQHYQPSLATNLIARPWVATLQLSLDSSRYPALHANRDGYPLLQLAAIGPLPACHPLTDTPVTMLANTPPVSCTTRTGEETVTLSQMNRHYVPATFISTWPTLLFSAKTCISNV